MVKNSKNSTGREFKVNLNLGEEQWKDVSLHFRRPTQKELFDIDMSYRTAMTRLLKAGVMTSHAATKIFEESGDWKKSDEQNMRNTAILIAQLSKQLEDEKDKKSREQNLRLAERITELRGKQLELINRKTDLFNNCAELMAEQQKMHTLAMLCCLNSDNERFFSAEEDYQKFVKDNVEAASVIFSEAYAFDYGVDVNKFGQDWAEVKYLREEAEKEKAEKSAAAELVAEDDARDVGKDLAVNATYENEVGKTKEVAQSV